MYRLKENVQTHPYFGDSDPWIASGKCGPSKGKRRKGVKKKRKEKKKKRKRINHGSLNKLWNQIRTSRLVRVPFDGEPRPACSEAKWG
jgi:hypothetical protein